MKKTFSVILKQRIGDQRMERIIKCKDCSYFRLYSGRSARRNREGYCKRWTVEGFFNEDTLCVAPEEILKEEAQHIEEKSW